MIKNSEDIKRYEELVNCKFLLGDMISFTNANGVKKYAIFLSKKGELVSIWCDNDYRCITMSDNIELVYKAAYNQGTRKELKEEVAEIVTISGKKYKIELITESGITK